MVVSFLGGFDGSLDLLHLAKHGGAGDIEKTYPVKTKVRNFCYDCDRKLLCTLTLISLSAVMYVF